MTGHRVWVPREQEDTSSVEINFIDAWKHMLNDEEKRNNGIWLRDEDVSVRSRYDPAHGMQVHDRYQPQVSLNPIIVQSVIDYDLLFSRQRDEQTLIRDLKIEMVQALQSRIEESMIENMLKVGQERELNMPIRTFYDIEKLNYPSGSLNLGAVVFPSQHIPKGEILVIVDVDTYHRFLVPTFYTGEIPFAPKGKIKWIPSTDYPVLKMGM